MTTDKARKRAVRTRMQKTGERYAAARRHVTAVGEAAPPSAIEPAQPASTDLPPRVADPGMAEEGIRKGTGQGWDDWLARARCVGRHDEDPHRDRPPPRGVV